MPFLLQDSRADTIVHFLRTQSEGANLNQMRQQFTPPLPERTARRLVANLVALGVLTTTSGQRYCRYELRKKADAYGDVVWLNPEGEAAATLALLTKGPRPAPIRERRPSNTEGPTSNQVAVAHVDTGSGSRVQGPGSSTADPESRVASASPPDIPSSAISPPPFESTLPATKTIIGARVQEVLNRALPKLSSGTMTPDGIAREMQLPGYTSFVLKGQETPQDLAILVIAALDTMSAEQAAKYGWSRDTFVRWREIRWPAGFALHPPGPVAPLPPLPLPKPMAPERLALFLREIPYVITSGMKPAALRPYLDTQKGWLRGTETVDDWVTILTAELNRLRLEDAMARKVRPEQYRLWRKEAWPVPPSGP